MYDHTTYQREYSKRPEVLRKRRDNDLRRKYGITLDQLEEMRIEQSGRCGICGRVEADSRFGRLYVDHDHASGEVRGLLCHTCNLALGAFEDNPELLQKALDWLVV